MRALVGRGRGLLGRRRGEARARARGGPRGRTRKGRGRTSSSSAGGVLWTFRRRFVSGRGAASTIRARGARGGSRDSRGRRVGRGRGWRSAAAEGWRRLRGGGRRGGPVGGVVVAGAGRVFLVSDPTMGAAPRHRRSDRRAGGWCGSGRSGAGETGDGAPEVTRAPDDRRLKASDLASRFVARAENRPSSEIDPVSERHCPCASLGGRFRGRARSRGGAPAASDRRARARPESLCRGRVVVPRVGVEDSYRSRDVDDANVRYAHFEQRWTSERWRRSGFRARGRAHARLYLPRSRPRGLRQVNDAARAGRMSGRDIFWGC